MPLELSSLNAAQREAVTAPDGHVLVIAGAGSGKTRTIVHRLAWLHERGATPESLLLLTFTRKAAAQMLSRAAELIGRNLRDVQGGTFHGFAYSVLRRHAPVWARGPVTIADSADSLAILRQCRDSLHIARGDRSFPRAQGILALLGKARNKELSLEDLLRGEAPHLLAHADALEQLGAAYAAYRREHSLLDYDDLLFELEALLRERPPEALGRLRYIMVDEYQDTNRVQARIVRLLAAGQGSVMAVGDDAQSIYAFRGADIHNILEFPDHFRNTRLIRLEQNYRSTQPVLDVANAVLARSTQTFVKRLFTDRPDGNPVRLVRPLSDLRQADLVVDRVVSLLEIYQPGEIAILFRAGYQSYHLELALGKRGLAFRKYGGLQFTQAAHVRDVLAFVRLVLNPLDRLSLERVAALSRGVGARTADRIFEALRKGDGSALRNLYAKHPDLEQDLNLLDALRAQPDRPDAILQRVLEAYRSRLEDAYPEDWPRRLQELEELTHMASAYEEVDRFVADVSLEMPDDAPEGRPGDDPAEARAQAVVLSTIHSAKGLEWDAVIIIDLVEDRFPSRHARLRAQDFEEERRLMYVACTRARSQLDLFVPQTVYTRAGGVEPAVESPFVHELPAGLCEEWRQAYGGQVRQSDVSAGEGASAASSAGRPAAPGECGYCRHKIFGRGKIVEYLPPDKCRVHFPGLGLKVILTGFLVME